jgi:hypothetical protein
MNFSQVVQAVIDITKRPDKKVETERAVNTALSFFIRKAEFEQDRVETSIPIDPNNAGGAVDLSTVLTRFRRFIFINRPDVRGFLKKISPEQLFTPGSLIQPNVYYIVGKTLNYVLASQAASLNVCYLQYPPILTGTDTHWFLDEASSCVIDKAASIIFQIIGDDSSMNIHAGMAKEWYDSYVRDLSMP